MTALTRGCNLRDVLRSERRSTTLALTALAAYRITRLVVADTITAPAREWVFDRWPPTRERAGLRWNGTLDQLVMREAGTAPKVVRATLLLDCPWCAGFWVTGLVVAAMRLERPVLTTFALSTVVGMIGAVDGALA